MLGRKILVLESDQAVAFPLAAALRKSGWIVISAPDAAAAMSVITIRTLFIISPSKVKIASRCRKTNGPPEHTLEVRFRRKS